MLAAMNVLIVTLEVTNTLVTCSGSTAINKARIGYVSSKIGVSSLLDDQ